MSKNYREKEYNNSNISSTPYDDVFRTMLNDCTRFILPLLNEIFGEHYDGTEKIVFANDYHFKNMQDGAEEKIITDSSFKVISKWGEKKYNEDETELKELVEEFEEICAKMEQLVQENKMTELESRIIVELSKKVVDNIAKKYKKIRRGVDVIMGGKVIETEAKKMYNRGRNEGENKKLKDQIKKKLAKGKDIAQIADEIEESEETVLELIKQIETEKQTI